MNALPAGWGYHNRRRLAFSSGSSGRIRGPEKHEIYAAAFNGNLFMTYFHRSRGRPWPPHPRLDPLLTFYRTTDTSVSKPNWMPLLVCFVTCT